MAASEALVRMIFLAMFRAHSRPDVSFGCPHEHPGYCSAQNLSISAFSEASHTTPTPLRSNSKMPL